MSLNENQNVMEHAEENGLEVPPMSDEEESDLAEINKHEAELEAIEQGANPNSYE